jgi:hypothetical protein
MGAIPVPPATIPIASCLKSVSGIVTILKAGGGRERNVSRGGTYFLPICISGLDREWRGVVRRSCRASECSLDRWDISLRVIRRFPKSVYAENKD